MNNWQREHLSDASDDASLHFHWSPALRHALGVHEPCLHEVGPRGFRTWLMAQFFGAEATCCRCDALDAFRGC